MEHSWIKNDFVAVFESLILNNPQHIVWAGDYAKECDGLKTNVYNRCIDKNEVQPTEIPTQAKRRYVINHTKKTFVDKNKIPDSDGWKIHPLPLLTCEGNGQGGGDYFGEDPNNLIGSWARDLISVSSKKPKDYTELIFDLVE